MKIQANMKTYQFSENTKVVQGKRTIMESFPNLGKQPIKVSISKEGYKEYRNNISGSCSFDGAVKHKKDLMETKLSTDLNFNFSFKIFESLSDEDKKTAGYRDLSMRGRVTNIAQTYASLYDEIVRGYENGTRKINVADSESETGYRTLTMEEELNALDEAYEKAAKTTEALAQQQPKIQKILEEYRNELKNIGTSKAKLVNTYEQQSKTNTRNVEENIYKKMITARDNWKNAYSVSAKSEAWQKMLSVISTMF
ncbi:MAG: hypothetical protein K2G45_02575 [Lachnospiraceae bacterium]|nr:hypothetical protein [Lachnospiraceae bacterium]